MKTTVETLEPYILEGRESIKLIVGHLMAVKAGDLGRMREALHEARALKEMSRRAEFVKVAHLCAHMESLIEAAELEGPEQVQESLEVLCDMCAHIVLYIDTVLLYADTFAMLVEFPWMRDALSRRLNHISGDMLTRDPAEIVRADVPVPATPEPQVVRLQAGACEGDPEATLNELHALYEEGPTNANWIVDLSRLREVPLWLMGALVSYHVELRRQGRRVRVTGIPAGASGDALHRLTRDPGAGGSLALA
jgi:chemotaxis protein histidine kinase CheA